MLSLLFFRRHFRYFRVFCCFAAAYVDYAASLPPYFFKAALIALFCRHAVLHYAIAIFRFAEDASLTPRYY